ncbi:MAG: HlyD family efflux transporter periplasmic adaptor subunit, partial [Flavobacteriales bacterium]|nr:HlyD family efflux transporter periplasmic adaptor subunit [Flavobacteriales bacterium]
KDAYSDQQRDAQRAVIQKTQASRDSVLRQINDTTMIAPMDGIVTERKLTVGENAVANSPIITISDPTNLIIESNISETDITKVALEQKAMIVFDALTDKDIFVASVIEIDPASTVIQDVVYYRVKLKLANVDARLKIGMSCDVDILTAQVDNVLMIPQRAIKNEDTKKRFEGVTITIKRNGTVWKTITSPSTGEFTLELPPDAIYLVEFSKPGFTTKKVEFSTKNVPPDDAKYGFEFPMEMNLFEEVEGLDVSILNQPIAKIAFNPSTGYMDYDPSYTKSIQKELEKLKKEQEEKRKQQEAERKEKAKEYATIIASADKLFSAKSWAEAKPLYEQAAKLLPSEDYPGAQLKLIATNMASAEEANKKYTTAIERADAAFKERNWEKATMEYNAASSHKPTEAYPKNKIKEIETIVANEKKVAKEYNDLLVTADAFFINKEYEKAKVDFQKASALKDYEKYPKDKLKEIEGLLAELAKKEAAEKALNEKYQGLITAADKALEAKSYQEAKGKYNEAATVKPTEKYPKDKLKEIEGLLA